MNQPKRITKLELSRQIAEASIPYNLAAKGALAKGAPLPPIPDELARLVALFKAKRAK